MANNALDTKPNTVLVKNVYYLMSYAFRTIEVGEFRQLGTEDFEGMDDLLAAIVLLGFESQRRRGFERNYHPVDEVGWRIKGQLDVRGTMAFQRKREAKAAYRYDEYSEDTILNRILKTSIATLVGDTAVSTDRRRMLRSALSFMQEVTVIDDPDRIRWSELRYHRSNRSYELLMNVCYMVIQRQLMDPSSNKARLALFDDRQQFSALFEGFLLNYFKMHFPQLEPAARKLPRSDTAPAFVPTMLTDVSLSYGKKKLILDAKCYGRILSMRYDAGTVSADHIRQIYYYASHSGCPGDVSAMLIYAGTEELPSNKLWTDNGYAIGCAALDLNTDFQQLSATLDSIALNTFGPIEKRTM